MRLRPFLAGIVALAACLLAAGRLATASAADPPRVFLIDPEGLVATRGRVAAGDAALTPAVERLRKEAAAALGAGPFSVVEKDMVPPSGDKHDYMSIGPYWWPDPDKPDGLPYIRRDGEVNPERHEGDNTRLRGLTRAVETLGLAYYLFEHEPYAEHAAKLLRTFFLDPQTRMNPHLQFGQAIPGRVTGRGIGLIDTVALTGLVDAVGMLEGSAAWTEDDQEGLVAWFGEYLEWMLTSDHGRAERRYFNNHGTWYDVQVGSFALFVGREDLVRTTLTDWSKGRIASQIEPGGAQQHELRRTLSFNYSVMNLRGFMHLATLGEQVGVDLWNYRTEDGRSIRAALDFLVPYARGEREWKHRQIRPISYQTLIPHLRRAAVAYGEPAYAELAARLDDDSTAAGRFQLLYPSAR